MHETQWLGRRCRVRLKTRAVELRMLVLAQGRCRCSARENGALRADGDQAVLAMSEQAG